MKQILRERERDKERAVKWNHFFHGDISVVAAKNRKWFKRGNTDLQKGPKQNFKPCIKLLNNKVVLEKLLSKRWSWINRAILERCEKLPKEKETSSRNVAGFRNAVNNTNC